MCQELPSLSNAVRFLSKPLIRKAHQSPPPPKREVCFNQKAFHSDVIGNNFLMNLLLFPRLACGPYSVGCLRALQIARLETNWKNGFQLHKISRTRDSSCRVFTKTLCSDPGDSLGSKGQSEMRETHPSTRLPLLD